MLMKNHKVSRHKFLIVNHAQIACMLIIASLLYLGPALSMVLSV